MEVLFFLPFISTSFSANVFGICCCCCVPSPSIIIIIRSRKKTCEKWHRNPFFSTSSDFLVIFLMLFFYIYFYCAEKEANLIFNRRWKYSCNIRYYVCHSHFFFKGKSNHCERERDISFFSYDYVTDVRWWC